ncbi:MAG TPA: NAD(P)H-dependent oxidoreductase, partial [Syntrophorhabdaceae bacterium]|nr:NAD(P)H-dependent oxidoreductase [Syntrophorhabdaceae bacterium]
MKATVLVGTAENETSIFTWTLNSFLEQKGYSVKTYYLSDMKIPPCGGEFDCWLKTPGICKMPGPHREIAASIIQSDLLVGLTPVTWGGYSYDLKKAMDHTIPLVSPLMESSHGLTYHVPRYRHYPDYLAIGILEKPDNNLEHIFETLIKRVVLNYYADHYDTRFIYRDAISAITSASLESWFPLRHSSGEKTLTHVDIDVTPPSR